MSRRFLVWQMSRQNFATSSLARLRVLALSSSKDDANRRTDRIRMKIEPFDSPKRTRRSGIEKWIPRNGNAGNMGGERKRVTGRPCECGSPCGALWGAGSQPSGYAPSDVGRGRTLDLATPLDSAAPTQRRRSSRATTLKLFDQITCGHFSLRYLEQIRNLLRVRYLIDRTSFRDVLFFQN